MNGHEHPDSTASRHTLLTVSFALSLCKILISSYFATGICKVTALPIYIYIYTHIYVKSPCLELAQLFCEFVFLLHASL